MASIALSTPEASSTALPRAVRLWMLVTALGQAMFLFYILGFYIPPALRGTFADWSRHRQVIHGYVAGDTTGNIMFGAHVAVAAVLTLGGVLQLWPALRRKAPALHRWNGRLFVATALFAALGGLWLVWVRGSHLGLANAASITLNAVLILAFVALAWRAARARDFAAHADWAIRSFLVVSGVWFLRIGVMAFALVAGGVFGAPKPMIQGFFTVWGFGSVLVPLMVFELYRRARASRSAATKTAMAVTLIALTGLMAVGIGGATMMMWMPALEGSGLFG
jgi:hypothetical protein